MIQPSIRSISSCVQLSNVTTSSCRGFAYCDSRCLSLVSSWLNCCMSHCLPRGRVLHCGFFIKHRSSRFTLTNGCEEVRHASVNIKRKPGHEDVRHEASQRVGAGEHPAQDSVCRSAAEVFVDEGRSRQTCETLLSSYEGCHERELSIVSSRLKGEWGHGYLLNVVFCHPVTQGVAGHFEEPARFRDVARRLLERFFKHLFFQFLKREPKGQQ